MWKPKTPTRCLILYYQSRIEVVFKDKRVTFLDQSLKTVLERLHQKGYRRLLISIALSEACVERYNQLFDKEVIEQHRLEFAYYHAEEFFGESGEVLTIDHSTLTESARDLVQFVAINRATVARFEEDCHGQGFRLERLLPVGDALAIGLQHEKQSKTNVLLVSPIEITFLCCEKGHVMAFVCELISEKTSAELIGHIRRVWQQFIFHEVAQSMETLMCIDLLGFDEKQLQLPVSVAAIDLEDYVRLAKVGVSLWQ